MDSPNGIQLFDVGVSLIRIWMYAQAFKIASMEDYGFWDFGFGRWLWYEMASQNGIMSLLEGLMIKWLGRGFLK